MRYILYTIALISIFGCSKYQKVVKKGTSIEKLEAARMYYKKNDFVRAQPLLEELLAIYFGKPEREEIFYYYANSHYGLSQFLLAGYYFNSFVESYPRSKRREEASYMAAICNYHKSMPVELDQTGTTAAINALQGFINKYPNSSYIDECNTKIDELRNRLLTKAYDNAMLYYHLGEYKSAVVALTNALDDYPDMIHRDQLSYLIVDASFEYAKNSIDTKQEERYTDVLSYVKEYYKEFNLDSQYSEEVLLLKEKVASEMAKIITTTSKK